MKRCIAAQTKARKAAKRRAKKACKADGKRGRALKRCVRDKLAAEPAGRPSPSRKRSRSARPRRTKTPRASPTSTATAEDALEDCVAEQQPPTPTSAEGETAEDDDLVDEEPGEDELVEPSPTPALALAHVHPLDQVVPQHVDVLAPCV